MGTKMQDKPKKPITIAKAEDFTGLPRSTIYHYEKIGLFVAQHDVNGYRQYTEEDIDTLKRIKLLRALDMPIEKIKQILSDPDTISQESLSEHIDELYRLRRHIDNQIEFAEKLELAGSLPFELGIPVNKSVDALIDELHEKMESDEYRAIVKNFTVERAEVVITYIERLADHPSHDPDDEEVQKIVHEMCCYIRDNIMPLSSNKFPVLPLALMGDGKAAHYLDDHLGEGTSHFIGVALLRYYADYGEAIWGER